MSKIAVVYWSGTGNTQAMAQAVVEGAQGAGAQAELTEAGAFAADALANYDAVEKKLSFSLAFAGDVSHGSATFSAGAPTFTAD